MRIMSLCSAWDDYDQVVMVRLVSCCTTGFVKTVHVGVLCAMMHSYLSNHGSYDVFCNQLHFSPSKLFFILTYAVQQM
jgi:hypothetical protein